MSLTAPLLCLVIATGLELAAAQVTAAAAPGQARSAADSVPADAYADPAVRELIARARARRGREVTGIRSYAATLRERLYVGLSVLRFRRERALFEQERAARIWWSAESPAVVKWLGARRRLPILGSAGRVDVERGGERERVRGEISVSAEGGRAAEAETLAELRRELEQEVPPMPLDPGEDRLFFLGSNRNWALHPLSDTADYHYRYRSGDTLRIRLPTQDQVLTLVEAIIEPREALFERVTGSIWFDADSARIVRATMRPARPFDLDLDEPEDAGDVPAFLKPIQVAVDYMTMDYSLQEMRWWLPRRMALHGHLSVGRVVSVPVTFEWAVSDYVVDQLAANPDPGPDSLPAGWTRATATRRRRGAPRELAGSAEQAFTVIVPPAESLAVAPELPAPVFEGEALGFDSREIDELREYLAQMPVPAFRPPSRVAWGPGAGLARYKRVEGLALGANVVVPLSSRAELSATGMLGTANLEPSGRLQLSRTDGERSWILSAYRDLAWVGEWSRPLSFAGSLEALISGRDDSQYYYAAGASVGRRETGGLLRSDWRVFAERHNSVSKHSDFSVSRLLGSDAVIAGNSPIEPGAVYGVAGGLRAQSGVDPSRLLVSGRVWGELAGGDFDYQRLAATVAVTRPLFLRLAAAIEGGAGTSWGHLPVQRDYALGGPWTLRGFRDLSLRGSAFWFARAELASGFPGARVALFGDLGWAGSRSAFRTSGDHYAAGVGAGFSLLDGLMRVDLARAVRGGEGWRLHAYLDALF
ncbi:MAG: BamA/TamA family outer membrane protein [Gemmatimonadetes bacterium]|nr:BamA/TamA family outer membrane protein [Gemmatimonadota bacterium]